MRNYIFYGLLLLIGLSHQGFTAPMMKKGSYWKCVTYDKANKAWTAQSSYRKVAINVAFAACKKESQLPATCKTSISNCEGFINGVSTRPMWRCTAIDITAQPWESNFYSNRDDAALAAQAYCKENSTLPATCYINMVTCANKMKEPTQMVYSVGLTGNIASGKSTVAEFFSELGINVIYADKIAKELTSKDTPCYQDIISHFGSSVVLNNGELDRKRIRDIIFSNSNERLWLESLLHPVIRKKIEEQLIVCTSPYCLIEIPLLFNKHHYPYLQKVLLVIAPLESQLDRIVKRDHCTKKQALAILATQPNLEQRLEAADDVLINESGLSELKAKVNKLHQKYLREAKIKQ